MPNLKTWHDYKNIYSVDMMFAYLNSVKHPILKLPVDSFVPQLSVKAWGDWSPMEVLEKMETKKYQANAKRIREANMSYPIIVTGSHTIVDGYHRVAKAYMEGKKEIRAYVFDAALMKKCMLVKGMDFGKLNGLAVYDIVELWNKRFCK